MKIRVLLLTTLAFLGIQNATVRTQQPPPPAGTFVAGEVLISYEPWATETTQTLAKGRVNATRKRALRSGLDGRLELATLPPGVSVEAAIASLSNVPGVQFAEPNWVYTRTETSNDQHFLNGNLWGMLGDASSPANQYGSQAAEAWSAGWIGNDNVYVGVIDEGIDFNHPDLAANIWVNPFDPVDGIDNDGNGYVDDVRGWDFFQNNNSVFDGISSNLELDSHGTHVAGTIGATGGNSIGVVGVNWNVTIIPLKFLGPNGGNTADAIEALNYITDLKMRHGLNITATNNSWGGGGFSQALLDAITRAAKADILFVAAAGNFNRNNDTSPSYPSNYNTTTGSSTEPAASYDSVIAVASITSSGARSSFSHYGATTVDLGAPGSSIASTTPFNTYSSFSGTSMATPHVTGAVALYASMQSAAPTALQIKQAILASAYATPTPSLAGITVTGGRLNISYFLTGTPLPPPPPPPTGLSATAVGATQIDLTWSDQSTDETQFRIERCTGSTCTAFAQIATVAANVTSYSNTGLSSSTTYRYRVLAVNSGTPSTPSNIASATTTGPPPVPASPSGLTATPVSSSQINLAWTDNSSNETGFRVDRCQNAGCTAFQQVATVEANVTTFSNTGLPANTTFRYRIRAFNSTGLSGSTNVVLVTTLSGGGGAPTAPTGLTATAASSSQINLSWSDQSSNETGFRVERCQGASCTDFASIGTPGANATSFSSTGLAANTTYRYRVFAVNAIGDSTASNIASATTLTAGIVPNAPSGVTATAVSSSQINIAWSDQSTNETGFRIERCAGAGCTSFSSVGSVGTNATSFANTGLAAGTTYRYRVIAFNATGDSSASNIAEATTTGGGSTLPATPTNFRATAGPGSLRITLTWTDNSGNESGFRIFRCGPDSCGSQIQVAELGANVTTFADTLPATGRYAYVVRAFNGAGMSAPSNGSSAIAAP